MAALLEIRGLRRERAQGGVSFTLEMPHFQLSPGNFVAVVGDSGCGKSTLLDLLALVLQPGACQQFSFQLEQRQIDARGLWRGHDEAALAMLRRRYLGYVLQTGGLLPFLSVRENLRLPMKINHQPVDETGIVALAERLGIAPMLDKKPQHLSGGQRQRAAIARALIHRPRIILADEPTAAVDKPRARGIVKDLQHLARAQGVAVVMVTHDRDLVSQADHTYSFDLKQQTDSHTHSICGEIFP
ncbi:ABC transporter ATP-binding protein [Magnetococcus sp. PR-3]|uniref:ABC transporter ATP-binding protein n=1 Tax=Magnetococcus sp. PR-3 TaxID=3120355 RepID=UPI002FCDE748